MLKLYNNKALFYSKVAKSAYRSDVFLDNRHFGNYFIYAVANPATALGPMRDCNAIRPQQATAGHKTKGVART